ncbi:MAG: DUF4412 domain-containing protein [Chitinophagales bacterium]
MKKYKITALSILMMFGLGVFAQGYYMEMKMSGNDGEMGTMKIYSQDGNSRSEMQMSSAKVPAGFGAMAILSLKSEPSKIYMLNEKEKTYSEMDVSNKEEYRDGDKSEYEVTVIGKEKVNGYNCTHVKIKQKGSKHDMDWWTTTEMANYAEFSKVKSQYTGKSNLYSALEAKGAVGFPVRIKTEDHGQMVQIDLITAEKRNNPSTMFSLSGYKKSEGPAMPGAGMGIDYSKIQQMTPEERQKWIEQMKNQYSTPH